MAREPKVIVYSDGVFHDQPAPGWYRTARELEVRELDWHRALNQTLGVDHPDLYAIDPIGPVGMEICVWRSKSYGTYVETADCVRTWDAIWVPLPRDWWPFQAHYLLPLVASASNLAVAEGLTRIGNALIGHYRHGTGSHIDRETGESRIDIRRDREQRMNQRSST